MNKRSDFLRGWGKMTELVRLLVNDILAAGGDDKVIDKALSDPETRRKIVDLIMEYQTQEIDFYRRICELCGAKFTDQQWKAASSNDRIPVVICRLKNSSRLF